MRNKEMAMYQHFEDVHSLVKEQSCIAEIIAIEAMKLTQRVTGSEERTINADLLHTLTTLVAKSLDIDELRIEHQQHARQRVVNMGINESMQRK